MIKEINRTNFHNRTFAIFSECKSPRRGCHYISESGSHYWYGRNKKGAYVIRLSDHWVKYRNKYNCDLHSNCKKIHSCNWQIKLKNKEDKYLEYQTEYCGKAYFEKFKFI